MNFGALEGNAVKDFFACFSMFFTPTALHPKAQGRVLAHPGFRDVTGVTPKGFYQALGGMLMQPLRGKFHVAFVNPGVREYATLGFGI